jgi:hypothetical protein
VSALPIPTHAARPSATNEPPLTRQVTVAFIVQQVCAKMAIPVIEFKGTTRHTAAVFARELCSYLCRNLTLARFEDIAPEMGRTNHSTCVYGCGRFQRKLDGGESMPDIGEEFWFSGKPVAEVYSTVRTHILGEWKKAAPLGLRYVVGAETVEPVVCGVWDVDARGWLPRHGTTRPQPFATRHIAQSYAEAQMHADPTLRYEVRPLPPAYVQRITAMPGRGAGA